MKEEKIQISLKKYDSIQELPVKEQELCRLTKDFAKNAYAPYSNFRVSAVALLTNGAIVKGTNVENASYPVGICAERTLIGHAVSNYPEEAIETLVIYVDKDLQRFVSPCGLCRQSLLETETNQNSPIKILLLSFKGEILQINRAKDLLPLSFNNTDLA